MLETQCVLDYRRRSKETGNVELKRSEIKKSEEESSADYED